MPKAMWILGFKASALYSRGIVYCGQSDVMNFSICPFAKW